jgi:hypothetical protein
VTSQQVTVTTSGGPYTTGPNNGALSAPLTISGITLNDVAECGTPEIRVWPTGNGTNGNYVSAPLEESGGAWSVTFPAGEKQNWTPGTPLTAHIIDGNGDEMSTFTFTLEAAP